MNQILKQTLTDAQRKLIRNRAITLFDMYNDGDITKSQAITSLKRYIIAELKKSNITHGSHTLLEDCAPARRSA